MQSLQNAPMFISDSAPYSLRSSNNIYIPPTPTIQSDFNLSLLAKRSGIHYHLQYKDTTCLGFLKGLKDHLVKNQIE